MPNGEIWFSDLIQDADEGPMLRFAQRSQGAAQNAVTGRLKVNPRVGDFFYVAGRLVRVTAVKHSGEDSATATVYPQVSIEPAIYPNIVTASSLTATTPPDTLSNPYRIWARLIGDAPPARWGADFAGPWTAQWIQWLPRTAGSLETAPLQQQFRIDPITLVIGEPYKLRTAGMFFDPLGDPVAQDVHSNLGKFSVEPSGEDFILNGNTLGGDAAEIFGYPTRGRAAIDDIVQVTVVSAAGSTAPTIEENSPPVALTIYQDATGTLYTPKTIDFSDNFSDDAERVVTDTVDPTIARGEDSGGMKSDFVPVGAGVTEMRVYGVDATGARSPALEVGVRVKHVRSGNVFDTGDNELFYGSPKAEFEALRLKATRIGELVAQRQYRLRDYFGPDEVAFSRVTVDDINRAGYGTNGAEDKGAVVTTQIDGEFFTVFAKSVNDLQRINRTLKGKTTRANWNDDVASTVRVVVTDPNGREKQGDLPVTLFYATSENESPVVTDNTAIELDTLSQQSYNLDRAGYDPEGTAITHSIRSPHPVGVTADFLESSQGYTGTDTRARTLRLTRTRALNLADTTVVLNLRMTDADGGVTDYRRNIILNNEDTPTQRISGQFSAANIPTIYVGDSDKIRVDIGAEGVDKDGLTVQAIVRGQVQDIKASVASTETTSPYEVVIEPVETGGKYTQAGRGTLSLIGRKAGRRGSFSRVYGLEVKRRPVLRPAWNLPTIINLTLGTDLPFDQDNYVVKNGNNVTYTRSISSAPTKFTALPRTGGPLTLHPVALNSRVDFLRLRMTGDDGVEIEGSCPVRVLAAATPAPTNEKPVCTSGVTFGDDADDPIYVDGSNRYRADFARIFRAGSASPINWGTLTLRPKASNTRSPGRINWERPSPIGTYLYFRGRSGVVVAGTQAMQARVASRSGVFSDWCDFNAKTTLPPIVSRPRLTFHPSRQFQVNKPGPFTHDYYDDTEWDGDRSDLAYSGDTGSRNNLGVDFSATAGEEGEATIAVATATQPVYPVNIRVWVKSNPSLFDSNSHQLTVLPAGGDTPTDPGPEDGDEDE